MDYNVKSSQPEETQEKIKASYAGIISRKMTVPPYEGKTYFEIMHFDDKEKDWHIGYGSFLLEYVQTWLDEEFEPTYKRLDEAITDLLARAEAAEDRAEKAERERDAAISAINNAYRTGAITVNDPKFMQSGVNVAWWTRTVKEE